MGDGRWEMGDGEEKRKMGGRGVFITTGIDGLRIHFNLITQAICHHYVNMYICRSRRENNDIASYIRCCHLALASFVWVS